MACDARDGHSGCITGNSCGSKSEADNLTEARGRMAVSLQVTTGGQIPGCFRALLRLSPASLYRGVPSGQNSVPSPTSPTLSLAGSLVPSRLPPVFGDCAKFFLALSYDTSARCFLSERQLHRELQANPLIFLRPSERSCHK